MYVKIEFTPDKTSNPTKGTLTATCETEIIHSDVVDIAKDNAREKFIKRLCNTAPAVNAGDVRHLILQQLAQINDRIKQQQQQEEERKENSEKGKDDKSLKDGDLRTKKKTACHQLSLIWAGLDSNQRRLTPTDLQSVDGLF